MAKFLTKTALAASVLLGLAGCEGTSDFLGLGDDERLVICPRVGVLADASRVTDFGPGGAKTVQNIAFEGEVTEAAISCDYDGDWVYSDIILTMDLLSGPVAQSEAKELQYFVAVTQLNTKVIDKQVFTYTAEFERGANRIVADEVVDGIAIFYPDLGRGDLYEILVGFELTEEQIAYNRSTDVATRPSLKRRTLIQ